MAFETLPKPDQTAARVFILVGTAVALGLLISGGWILLFDTPPVADERFLLGDRQTSARTPVEDVHGSLGDIAASLTLLIVAWWSYRVIASVSWRGVGCLVLVAATIITGGFLHIDAIVRDGQVVADAVGYGPVLAGNYDYLAVGQSNVGALAIRAWTAAHLVSMPALLATIFVARKQTSTGPARPSWLDHLETRK